MSGHPFCNDAALGKDTTYSYIVRHSSIYQGYPIYIIDTRRLSVATSYMRLDAVLLFDL